MSRMRHLLAAKNSTYHTLVYALEYLIQDAGQADFAGDHDKTAVKGFERALADLKAVVTPRRDLDVDARAIQYVADTACENSCSCVDMSKGHAADCWVVLARLRLDRLEALRKLLKGTK